MKKGLAICLCFCLLLLGLTGCKTDKEEISLLTEKEALRYAKNRFGNALVVSTEEIEDGVCYTLQDEEYGFLYTIKDQIFQVAIDASKTGFYDHTVSSNFDQAYRLCLMEKLKSTEKIYPHWGSNPSGDAVLFGLSVESEEEAKEKLPELAQKVQMLDQRKFFGEYHLGAYMGDEYLGSYGMKTRKYEPAAAENQEQMLRRFAVEVNRNSGDLTGITAVGYEKVQLKDVEQLEMQWLHDKELTPEDWTYCYYFDYKGQTYFMLDDIVFIEDAPGIRGNHYSDYYTSYWFE